MASAVEPVETPRFQGVDACRLPLYRGITRAQTSIFFIMPTIAQGKDSQFLFIVNVQATREAFVTNEGKNTRPP